IEIDAARLSEILEVPVVPTVAIRGTGINELLSRVVDVLEGRVDLPKSRVEYGKEIEESLVVLESAISEKLPSLSDYPARWIAVKLLERDEDITHKVRELEAGAEVLEIADEIIGQIEEMHGEPSPVVIASERYGIASRIAREVTRIVSPPRTTLEMRLNALTTHRLLGYPFLAAVAAAMFSIVFVAGDFLIGLLEGLFKENLIPITQSLLSQALPPVLVELTVEGFISGIVAGITIALPYIVPFYILLAILEDSGYLPRAAFLMDNLMHKIGLHGKAFIPLLLGYGCNVPACIGCRIMETDRERFLAGFVTVLIPCAARTVIILGLVGRYLGIHIALALYAFDLVLVFALGRLAYRIVPGEPVGLIMEMPPYRIPQLVSVFKKTWSRTKDFVYVAFPLIIAGSVLLQSMRVSGVIHSLAQFLGPLISGWLGLPELTGIPLIFGVLRKELTLVLLAQLAGTTDFQQILQPIQMIVFTLVTMIYIPCIATIAALVREFGWRRAIGVSIIDILLALTLGGVAYHLLTVIL
ncbi:MAG: ferrous iron transport protein B, partial [Candidatus Bathyarchaeia archaeon]